MAQTNVFILFPDGLSGRISPFLSLHMNIETMQAFSSFQGSLLPGQMKNIKHTSHKQHFAAAL